MHPLTDAFIKGRAKFKKMEHDYFDNDKKPKKACHFGAMYYGFYGKVDGPSDFSKDFPELHKMVDLPCNDSGEQVGWVSSILIHLNDAHDGRSGWTDEKVAAWLEQALTS